jgi:hypothetical protein
MADLESPVQSKNVVALGDSSSSPLASATQILAPYCTPLRTAPGSPHPAHAGPRGPRVRPRRPTAATGTGWSTPSALARASGLPPHRPGTPASLARTRRVALQRLLGSYAVWRDGLPAIRERVLTAPLLLLKARQVLGSVPEDEGRLLMEDLDMLAPVAPRARRGLRQGVFRRLLPPERQEVQRLGAEARPRPRDGRRPRRWSRPVSGPTRFPTGTSVRRCPARPSPTPSRWAAVCPPTCSKPRRRARKC